MVREAVAALVADNALNVVMAMPQTGDSTPAGATYDPSTGLVSNVSQQIHISNQDEQRFGMRYAPVAARAILASQGGTFDTISSFPSGIPALGGPSIVHAYLENSTTVILTVQHDAGADLVLPLQAVNGAGFVVMDGGSVASPGTLVPATACARIDATHLQLTLAQALVNPAADCSLFYPWGKSYIYSGNAVTDNFSTIAPPAGWNVLSDLAWTWNSPGAPLPNNYPLQATSTPITLSTTPD